MDTSITAFREDCEASARRLSYLPKGIKITQQTIANINCEWIIPDNSDTQKIILYIHGGGYVSGSCADHRGFVGQFALRCGYKNLVFDYRLAPEHPFPAGLEDSFNVYQELLISGYKANDIIIAGESAGGGLCLALLLYIRDKGLPLPNAAVAISPWTDLSCSSESYRTKNAKSLAPLYSWTVFSKHYVAENNVTNPYISPIFGDLHSLPSIYINSGKDDELFDDGAMFAVKAKKLVSIPISELIRI